METNIYADIAWVGEMLGPDDIHILLCKFLEKYSATLDPDDILTFPNEHQKTLFLLKYG